MTVKQRPANVSSSHGPKKVMDDVKVNESLVAKQVFITNALSMSWQMAIAVLVPIVGGFYLDKYFKTTPYLTLTGFVLAIILVVFIVRKTLNQLPTNYKNDDRGHK